MTLRPVGFLHIPKTAGSSVRQSLETAFAGERIGTVRFDDRIFGNFADYDSMEPELRRSILLPSQPVGDEADALLHMGHLSLAGMLRLLPTEAVFTVLREPRARLLSHQLFWAVRPAVRNQQYGDYQVHLLAHEGLAPFLRNDAAAHQHDNLICRMLVDAPHLIPPDRPIAPEHIEEVGALAVAALQRIGLATYVEDPAMWSSLSDFVGVPLQPERANTTEGLGGPAPFHGPQLTTEALELLDRRTAADQIAYSWLVQHRTGCTTGEAQRFAALQFASQAERYGRTAAQVVAGASAPSNDALDECRQQLEHAQATLQRRSVRWSLALAGALHRAGRPRAR